MISSPVNLISRLPALMQQYDEIQKITDSQNPEFDFIVEAEQLMRKNLYIITAEEHGLMRYEKLLGINPLPGESWQARRNHILVRWNKTTPYTFRFLIGLLEMMTGGNFEVIPNFDIYEMEIKVFTLDSGILSDLAYIMRHIIPANIALTSTNEITITIKNLIKIGACINLTRHYTISQDFKAELNLTANINQGAAISQIKAYTISQDFKAEYKPKSKTAASGSIVKIIEYRIRACSHYRIAR